MTESFYCAFLDYISGKEKQKLCILLQKGYLRVNGFRALKDVPTKLLASQIIKKEELFYKILFKNYLPTYSTLEEINEVFSPDTAVLCLTYLLNQNKADAEGLLSSLMQSTSENPAVVYLPQDVGNKPQKKQEEFRQKYLSTQKELEHKQKFIEDLESEINVLKIALSEKESIISELQESIAHTKFEYEEIIEALKTHIEQIEIKSTTENTTSAKGLPALLVLMNTPISTPPEVRKLSFEEISLLPDIYKDYEEILYVVNDLTFSTKRYIEKISNIQGKIHSFSTKTEMIEYIEKGRKV